MCSMEGARPYTILWHAISTIKSTITMLMYSCYSMFTDHHAQMKTSTLQHTKIALSSLHPSTTQHPIRSYTTDDFLIIVYGKEILKYLQNKTENINLALTFLVSLLKILYAMFSLKCIPDRLKRVNTKQKKSDPVYLLPGAHDSGSTELYPKLYCLALQYIMYL